MFLAACGTQESDRDDEHNLFHRGIISFNRRGVSYELSLPTIHLEDGIRHNSVSGFRDWLARQYFPHDLRQEPPGRLASPHFPLPPTPPPPPPPPHTPYPPPQTPTSQPS